MSSEPVAVFGIVPFPFDEPNLLILGSDDTLAALARFLRNVRIDSFVDASEWGRPANIVKLLITTSKSPSIATFKDGAVEWHISLGKLEPYAKAIEVLAASSEPRHAYLDPEGKSHLGIIVSKGEYTPEVFENLSKLKIRIG